ncbi:MAG: mucoidy inhibitor MuiA family protein [Flavobacteriales bacterium]
MNTLKSLLTATCSCLFLLGMNAQSNIKKIESKISDVLVFQQGAQITESGSIALKEGENQFKFTGISQSMDPNSIQVEGNANYTILSVRYQQSYNTEESNARVKSVQDSLRACQMKLSELNGYVDVINQEKYMLEANRSIKGENAIMLMEDLKEMADFYRNRYTELNLRNIELQQQIQDKQAECNKLNNRLNILLSGSASEIIVTLLGESSITSSLKVRYVVPNAGWYPIYDLRAKDINSPIEFAYRAKVYQSTGKDWEKVNLTLSTGNPNAGGQAPELVPWYLYGYEYAEDRKRRQDNYRIENEEKANAPAQGYASDDDGGSLFKDQTLVTQQSNTVNNEFKIAVPYSIPSNNQQYDVIMKQEVIPATYAYITIPKLDNDAFLRAQLVDWAQYALLPGESNIYFNNAFVGKGYIDPLMTNDTLNVSLGRDAGIVVKREQVKDFCKTNLLGNIRETKKSYSIKIKNNKKEPVKMVIEDQLPLSTNQDILIVVEEISGATEDLATGKLTWNKDLNPGQEETIEIRFSVKYPKKWRIGGL